MRRVQYSLNVPRMSRPMMSYVSVFLFLPYRCSFRLIILILSHLCWNIYVIETGFQHIIVKLKDSEWKYCTEVSPTDLVNGVIQWRTRAREQKVITFLIKGNILFLVLETNTHSNSF